MSDQRRESYIPRGSPPHEGKGEREQIELPFYPGLYSQRVRLLEFFKTPWKMVEFVFLNFIYARAATAAAREHRRPLSEISPTAALREDENIDVRFIGHLSRAFVCTYIAATRIYYTNGKYWLYEIKQLRIVAAFQRATTTSNNITSRVNNIIAYDARHARQYSFNSAAKNRVLLYKMYIEDERHVNKKPCNIGDRALLSLFELGYSVRSFCVALSSCRSSSSSSFDTQLIRSHDHDDVVNIVAVSGARRIQVV
uniref:Uncharacterized protein n=1 Tax=Trichogramma kaykai TaxID=54128 RepID=A0ABD2WEL1_9HYME